MWYSVTIVRFALQDALALTDGAEGGLPARGFAKNVDNMFAKQLSRAVDGSARHRSIARWRQHRPIALRYQQTQIRLSAMQTDRRNILLSLFTGFQFTTEFSFSWCYVKIQMRVFARSIDGGANERSSNSPARLIDSASTLISRNPATEVWTDRSYKPIIISHLLASSQVGRIQRKLPHSVAVDLIWSDLIYQAAGILQVQTSSDFRHLTS